MSTNSDPNEFILVPSPYNLSSKALEQLCRTMCIHALGEGFQNDLNRHLFVYGGPVQRPSDEHE